MYLKKLLIWFFMPLVVIPFVLLVWHTSIDSGQQLYPVGQTAVPQRPAGGLWTEPALPETLTLCGVAIPLEDQWVREMLDRELTISAWDTAQVFMWLKRKGRYFPYIENRLAEAGLPDDLKYLAVAESALITHISSPMRAKGIWQFIAATGRRYGLRTERRIDERMDYRRATTAAIAYLKDLHEMFGSWPLAMAAYNCGEARVKREIREQQTRDYFQLNLPLETERYIYRIASVKLILESPATYGFTIDDERIYAPLDMDVVPVELHGRVHLKEIVPAVQMSIKGFKDNNPHILGYHLPTGRYTLYMPAGKGPLLADLLNRAPAAAQYDEDIYVVARGDTLIKIANKTGVSVEELKRLNNVKGSHIWVGQKLKLTE